MGYLSRENSPTIETEQDSHSSDGGYELGKAKAASAREEKGDSDRTSPSFFPGPSARDITELDRQRRRAGHTERGRGNITDYPPLR